MNRPDHLRAFDRDDLRSHLLDDHGQMEAVLEIEYRKQTPADEEMGDLHAEMHGGYTWDDGES